MTSTSGIYAWKFDYLRKTYKWFNDQILAELINELGNNIPVRGFVTQTISGSNDKTTIKANFYLIDDSCRILSLHPLLSAPNVVHADHSHAYQPCLNPSHYQDQWDLFCLPIEKFLKFLDEANAALVVDIGREMVSGKNLPSCTGATRFVFPKEMRIENCHFDFFPDKLQLCSMKPQKNSVEYIASNGMKICDMRDSSAPGREKLRQCLRNKSLNLLNDPAKFEDFVDFIFSQQNKKPLESDNLRGIMDFLEIRRINACEIFSGHEIEPKNVLKRMTYKNTEWPEELCELIGPMVRNPCYVVIT